MDDLTRLALDAAGGDRPAFASLVRRTQADVWRFCSHLVDADAVDDVTQDVFLRAAKALPSFRADASARTWLLAIARRACADEVRRRTRRRALQRRLDAQPSSPSVPAGAGGVELDELLRDLDPDRRAAFVLTQVLGLGYEAAAEACECPVGTIRSRVARARADLLAALHGDAGNRSAARDDH